MLDPEEREVWFQEYLRAGLKFRGDTQEVRDWAKSMSLIAEQFVDNTEGDPVDSEPVS